MSSSIDRLARRLDRVEKDIFNGANQPRLPFSSIDSGALEARDINGSTQATFGEQWDGTITSAAMGGTTPVSPTMPLVTPQPGGLSLYWDGTYVDGSPTRMDFKRVTFHAVTDVDLFDALSAAQIVGEITIATGGEVSASLAVDEWFIFAVTWTDAGKFSVESDPGWGTPIDLATAEEWQEHEDALEVLNGVTLPALQDDLNTLNALDLPDLRTDLTNLQTVTLPSLQGDLDGNTAALEALNTSTLPGLQAAATAAQQAADAAALDASSAIESALAAAAVAGSAQAAADGAIRTYGPEEYPVNPPWANGSTQPENVIGDLWLNGDGVAHRWNGTTWYVIPDSAAANALAQAIAAQGAADAAATAATSAYERWAPTGQTTIDGGKLTADSVTSAQIKANTITANDIAAKTITAAEIKANTVTANEVAAKTLTAAEIKADTITAAEIAADTITANEIAARTITGTEIAANAITAEELDVEVLRSGFTLTGALEVTGAINVGTSSWTKDQGLVFPGALVLPADPTKRASISADITAKSMTVEKDLNILGTTNKVSGQLSLSNGVTRPTVAPTVWASWPSVQTGNMEFGAVYYGAIAQLSDPSTIIQASAFFGGSVSAFNKATGQRIILGGSTPWGSGGPFGFNPVGGITSLGSNYYVLGQDSARNNDWYIYKLDSAFQKVAETAVGIVGNSGRGRPTIGNDGAVLLVAGADGSNAVDVLRYTTTLAYQGLTSASFSTIGATPMSAILYGTFDFGSPRYIFSFEGNNNYVTDANYNRLGDNVFAPANGIATRGLHWADGRFYTFGRDGSWAQHGKNTTISTLTASYTHYDGVGTVRETEGSPAATFALPTRSWVNMNTNPAPDSGSSEVNVDKANRVRFYIGVNGGSRRLQGTGGLLTDGVTTDTRYSAEAVTTSGSTEPVVNGFIGGNTSPGTLRSAATDGNGALTELSGTGAARINGQTIADSGWNVVGAAGQPAFTAGWQNFGAPMVVARFKKLNGVVYVQGLIRLGTMGSAAFTLPAGYRPSATIITNQIEGGNASGRLDITAGGAIIPTTGSATYYSITTSFPADQ